jgi:hypothetical protein
MALVNPNIAMSYRPTVEYQPRNALAEYAQVQQIMGGQRQAEIADMQLEKYRQDRSTLDTIRQAIVAKGGPPDLEAAADAMIKSGNPDYMERGSAIRETLNSQRRWEAYQRQFNPAPTSAPGAIAPAEPQGEAVPGVAPIRPYGVPAFSPSGEGAAQPTNAMAAAQPAAQPANAMVAAGANRLTDLESRYSQVADINTPGAKAEAQLLRTKIEAALRSEGSRPVTVSPGQVVYDPRTGQQVFAAPAAATALSDRFVPVGRLVFDRQTQQYISPTQAQLAQSQERAASEGAASRGKPPSGYRFTPAGDLEPIPGGPAARAAEGAAAPRPLTAAQEVARRDKLGKEFKSATAALQTTQEVLDSISFVRSEPGLSRATGYTGLLPSIPEGAAASAETRLKNLEGKITALGKAQAAATGAIGSIANQEWQILRDQIAAIDRKKGTQPLLAQLELVEQQAQGAMSRIRDAYQRQFGEDFERFPQFSDLPQPRSSFRSGAPATSGRIGPAAPQGTGSFRYLGKEAN